MPRSPVVVFSIFAVLSAALLTTTYLSSPYDPSLEGTRAYGHTADGELLITLEIALGEAIVLLLLLRPWSYDRSWERSLAALVLATPWALLMLVMSQHAGPTTLVHTLLLLLLWLVLAASTVFSFATRKTKATEQ